jgi:hypothetical protein
VTGIPKLLYRNAKPTHARFSVTKKNFFYFVLETQASALAFGSQPEMEQSPLLETTVN